MARGREYTRVLLAVCCIAALVLSAISLPAISDGPTNAIGGQTQSGDGQAGAGTQNESAQNASNSGPGQRSSTAGGQSASSNTQRKAGTSSSGAGSGGALGALSTGDRTTVGGNLSAFRSTGQQIHFTVQSTQPSYWRTNAYKKYTTSGWADQGELTAYDGDEIAGDTERQQRVSQRYELRRAGNSLPAAWRPVAMEGVDSDVQVTDQQALKTRTRFEPGATYVVLSYTPPRDPERLRESGRSYPAPITNQYTQLPSSTRDQLEPFTRQIVGDSDSPYTTAVRIEEWLETNKDYSLDASHDAGTDVATEFVFNMNQGYCEYFATAMVAMLRSQDIPARYVTGYSTGQPVGENEYVVRGMNAHAWVEVYLEDIGWVRFDATPGSARLDAEAQAYAQGGATGSSGSSGSGSGSGPGGSGGGSGTDDTATPTESGTQSSITASEYQHTEEGSPGETMGSPSTNGSASSGSSTTSESQDSQSASSDEQSSSEESDTEEETADSDDSSANESTPPLETELNRTELIPGTDIQVTVTRDDKPVAGVTVLFNGDAVGDTDQEGTVVGTVPYTAELNVTVTTGSNTQSIGYLPPLESSSQFKIQSPPVSVLRVPATSSASSTDVDSYEVETNATVNVTGPPIPDSSVVITATINGTSLPDATVTVGDANVTETNQSGQARVILPAEVQQTQVQVSRGAVSGERDVTLLTELNVSVQGEFYPRGEAIVNVTARGNGVENATVAVGDRGLGRTDDGTVTGQFPQTTSNVTVTATKGIAEGTQTVNLKELTVTATPKTVLAFPWTGVQIESKLENESTGGVAIQVNRRPVGETKPNGMLNATLPPTYGVTVTAIGYGQRVSTTAGNPLLVLLIVILSSLLVVGVAVRKARRSKRTARGSIATIAEVMVRLSQRLFGAIVTLASRVDNIVQLAIHTARRLRDDITAIPGLLRLWAQRIQQRLAAVLNWSQRIGCRITTWGTELARSIDTVVRNPKQSLLLFVGWLRQLFRPDDSTQFSDTDDYLAEAGATQGLTDEEEESRLTVREAWREFLGYVSVRRWKTKTPGQISRHAIDSDGLPPDAVRVLTDSFRDVEYGNRSARDTVAGARDALDEIKRAVHREEEGKD